MKKMMDQSFFAESLIAKTIFRIIRLLNLGSGSSLPGHICLKINPEILKLIFSRIQAKVILVVGTNGKTTTAKMIHDVLRYSGKKVLLNSSGANLLAGIVTSLLVKLPLVCPDKYDYIVLEVDENVLSTLSCMIKPKACVFLNLFRDQLDRYGELCSILDKWKKAIDNFPEACVSIVNAHDPQLVNMFKQYNKDVVFFAAKKPNVLHQTEILADVFHCPSCGTQLSYKWRFCGHLGEWQCFNCDFTNPNAESCSDLGLYEPSSLFQYNIQAAFTLLSSLDIEKDLIAKGLSEFSAAFGRREIIKYKNRKLHISLIKNATSVFEELNRLDQAPFKTFIIILNNHEEDGQDVSWIWDVDFSKLRHVDHIFLSGTKAKELRLRITYELDCVEERKKVHLECDPIKALNQAVLVNTTSKDIGLISSYSGLKQLYRRLQGRRSLWI